MAKRHSFSIDIGFDRRKPFAITADGDPVDLTGYSGSAALYRNPEDAVAALELTIGNGGFEINEPGGIFTLVFTAVATATLSGQYAFEARLTSPGGALYRKVQGIVTAIPKGTLYEEEDTASQEASTSDETIHLVEEGPQGPPGGSGWTPVLSIVADGARLVHKVVDWTGGTGTKPAVNLYVGLSGLSPNIADGVNISASSAVFVLGSKHFINPLSGRFYVQNPNNPAEYFELTMVQNDDGTFSYQPSPDATTNPQ